MIDTVNIEKYNKKRGGMDLFYNKYILSIYVDAINCVYISIGTFGRNFVSFSLFHNYGYSLDEYIKFIKDNMDTSKFPPTHSIKIFKELLDDPDFRNCLDNCIKNIPDNIYIATEKQIAKAREKYETTIKSALVEYESAVREIASTAINVEHAMAFSSSENYGLVDEEILKSHEHK